MVPSANKDFWLSCGHHLLDRDAGGGLIATDEFLKVYLARPELTPPREGLRPQSRGQRRVGSHGRRAAIGLGRAEQLVAHPK